MLSGISMLSFCARGGGEQLVNIMPNSDFAAAGAIWSNNNIDALSFITGKALINDQFGDGSQSVRLLYQTVGGLVQGVYKCRVEVVDYVRGGIDVRSGVDPLMDGAKLGAGVFMTPAFSNPINTPSREFAISVLANSLLNIKRFELFRIR